MKKLIIATKNSGKAKEVALILEGMGYEIVSLADYPDAPKVEETGKTFIKNAIIKAKTYADFTGELTLADDSGLEVDALNGAPGVFSSRFAPTDEERNSKLLELMKETPDANRTARFICAIAIAEPGGEIRTCEGKVEGTIAHEPKGDQGFGYDPVFYLPHLGKSMAELNADQKNSLSHRGKALEEAKKIMARN